jgi:hypothetical protein
MRVLRAIHSLRKEQLMFSTRTTRRFRAVTQAAIAVGSLVFAAAAPALAQKDRLTVPIKNDDVIGTNANQFRAELRGTNKFYSWAAINNANMPLFNNGDNNGQNIWTENFTAPNVVTAGTFMLLDTIVDKNAKLARKAEPGVSIGPSTLRIGGQGGRDVVTRIDPLNRFVRRPIGNRPGAGIGSVGFEVELENGSDDAVMLSGLEIRINNFDDPLDFSTPFTPDGSLASMDQPFVPMTLLPGESAIYTYSGSFDESLAVSVLASSTLGADSYTGLMGTHVPEPGAWCVAIAAVGLLLRRQRSTI